MRRQGDGGSKLVGCRLIKYLLLLLLLLLLLRLLLLLLLLVSVQLLSAD
jgi:hypothetical protein